jgi:hypothetical protein
MRVTSASAVTAAVIAQSGAERAAPAPASPAAVIASEACHRERLERRHHRRGRAVGDGHRGSSSCRDSANRRRARARLARRHQALLAQRAAQATTCRRDRVPQQAHRHRRRRAVHEEREGRERLTRHRHASEPVGATTCIPLSRWISPASTPHSIPGSVVVKPDPSIGSLARKMNITPSQSPTSMIVLR